MSTYVCDACDYGICKVIVNGDIPGFCIYDPELTTAWIEVHDLPPPKKGWKCSECGRQYYTPEEADECCPAPAKQEENPEEQ